ncbi:MAG TPA: hypothetical protein VGG65_00010 [Thermoanaerobaculia bacterium]|jgi:hypothetical protein
MTDPGTATPLEDFPLRDEHGIRAPRAPAPEQPVEPGSSAAGAAPPGARLSAAAADAAAVLLLAALAILGARVLTGRTPHPAGLPWALLFLVDLSFFATVPALVLFGRTVGMAISDLSARSGDEAGLSADAAVRRWAGTLATAATAGLLLWWTRRNPDLPTPADRFSGRPLSLD